MKNPTLNYNGGTIEMVKAGEFTGVDQQTGQPAKFTWDDHIRVTSRIGKAKLTGEAVEALADKLKTSQEFREWVQKCKS